MQLFLWIGNLYMDIKCSSCDNEAQIFHDEGDFCVYCWNEIKDTSPP